VGSSKQCRVRKVAWKRCKNDTIKIVARRPRKKQALQVTVVDAHHHALIPIWDAVQAEELPPTGVKMLHFDSHPDMGVFGSELNVASQRSQVARVKKLLPQIFVNSFNQAECLRLSDIATWIPTLVFQGLVGEVIWVCGAWCNQFPVGSVDLVVGRWTKNGMMRIGVPGDNWTEIVSYWVTDDGIVSCKELEMQRPWKLHIVKFEKDCSLRLAQVQKIAAICMHSPWILDIDEDYLSVQNPYSVQFKQFFGDKVFDQLLRTWGAEVNDDEEDRYPTALMQIARKRVYRLSEAKYGQHRSVREAVSKLAKGRSRSMATELMSEFRMLCQDVLDFDKNGSRYLQGLHVDINFLIDSGSLTDLPHHISTLSEITLLLESTSRLFDAIGTPPGVVTVATSRADEYTPEAQAYAINDMVLTFLKQQWKRSAEVMVHRRDVRDGLSIYDLEFEKCADLFLSGASSRNAEAARGATKAKFRTGVRGV